MGFFTSSKPDPEAETVIKRTEREKCWEKRDAFFGCLTQNEIDNSLDPQAESKVKEKCGSERREFENNCAKTWVSYFQQKRFNDLKKRRYIDRLKAEGAQELPFKISR